MSRNITKYALSCALCLLVSFAFHPHMAQAQEKKTDSSKLQTQSAPASETDWMRDAKLGAFMHFLPGSPEHFAMVDKFDVHALAAQLEDMGAKYFVFTLQQNSGYINSPNPVYDRYTGYKPGEKCSQRDLPLELAEALSKKNIKLLLYIPAQVPNRDVKAQSAFGLKEGPQDQKIDRAFALKWAEVLQEWSDRYGSKISGWWMDGCYEHVNFNDEIAALYARAMRHGNPKTVIAFNPGVKYPIIRWSQSENYTAGEINDPFGEIPTSRWVAGAQWHALTFMGNVWAGPETRFENAKWIEWVKRVTAQGGVVTLDMAPNYDPAIRPVGTFSPAQQAQFKAIADAFK